MSQRFYIWTNCPLATKAILKRLWKCENSRSAVFTNITKGWGLSNLKKTGETLKKWPHSIYWIYFYGELRLKQRVEKEYVSIICSN